MNIDWRDLEKLKKEQGSDMANALLWWRETTEASKMRLWLEIQKPHQNPLDECVSRMAQLGMTLVAIAAAQGPIDN